MRRFLLPLMFLLAPIPVHAEVALKKIENIADIHGFLHVFREIEIHGKQEPGAPRVLLSYEDTCKYGKSEQGCRVTLYLVTEQYSGHWGDTYLYSVGNLQAKDPRFVKVEVKMLNNGDADFWEYDVTCEKLPEQILEIYFSDVIQEKESQIAVGLWVQYFYEEAIPAKIVRKVKKNHKNCERYRYYFQSPG